MLKLWSIITPAAAAAASILMASPSFAQQKYHGRPSEQPQGGAAPAVESRQQQPERAEPRQQERPRPESQPEQQQAPPQRQTERQQTDRPTAVPRDQGSRDPGRTSDNRRSEHDSRRFDDNRRYDRDRAVPRGNVYAPSYEPRYEPRYSPRYTPRGYGYYGSHSYARPYVFRPRFSTGFGIYSGYPVPYTYNYGSPIWVFGYRAPRERVMIVPGSMYYGGIVLEMTPYDADVFVDGTYAGRVEDFDGTMQPLTLTTGVHEIEVQAIGYEPMRVHVQIYPGQIVPYRGDLRPY